MSLSIFKGDKFITNGPNSLANVLGIEFGDAKKHRGGFGHSRGDPYPIGSGFFAMAVSDGSAPMDERAAIERCLADLLPYGLVAANKPVYSQEPGSPWVFCRTGNKYYDQETGELLQ